jgi:hypothetical protein
VGAAAAGGVSREPLLLGGWRWELLLLGGRRRELLPVACQCHVHPMQLNVVVEVACFLVRNQQTQAPVQGLDEEQRCDHSKECDGEVLTEDGDGEEDLDDLPPGLLVEALDLGLPERAEEDALHELPGGAHGDEARVEEQHEADLGVGEVEHRRVELLPAAEGVVHRRHRRQQAERRVRLQPDHLHRRRESPAPKISPPAPDRLQTRASRSQQMISPELTTASRIETLGDQTAPGARSRARAGAIPAAYLIPGRADRRGSQVPAGGGLNTIPTAAHERAHREENSATDRR